MSKGSKQPSWKVVRNRYNAIGRELAALAGKTPAAKSGRKPRTFRPPAQTKQARAPLQMNARQRAVREWYLYGGVDEEPPVGLTEEELRHIRHRFCR
jgi:hypothetical protein